MPVEWATVPVFVSSTFGDIHAERDYLVKQVFPELREWCERRKLRLLEIDLRWGVTEEDATRHKNVVRVCLRNIDRCRPFFLCFLGQRYGWVPRAGDVSAETLALYPGVAGHLGRASVTELEVRHALLTPFDRSGRTSGRSFFYLREPSYLADLPGQPSRLRAAYADPPGSPVEALRAETVPATGRPAYPYHAAWRAGAGYRTPELALPLACPSAGPEGVARWRAEWQQCAGIEVRGAAIPEGSPEALRARAFNDLLTRGRLADFTCADPQTGDRVSLARVILDDLQGAIAAEFPGHAEAPAEDDLQRELDQHEQFRFEQCQGFVERPGTFAALDAYVAGGDDHLLVLAAPGGAGKSALLARWAERLLSGEARGPGAGVRLYARFVGASDRSSSADGLLRFLVGELKPGPGEDVPEDPRELRRALPRLLEAAGRRGPTVIVLDGLDQLETGLDDLTWLPRQLPPGVKLVAGVKSDEPGAAEWLDGCRRGGAVVAGVEPFDAADRRRLVAAYLGQYLKQLDEAAVEQLVAFPAAANPLFLKVVLAELRVFGSFANLRQQVRQAFGDDPVAAFRGVLERLAADPAYSALSPGRAVPLLFALLAHARRGLSADELTDLLVRHYPLKDRHPEVGPAEARDAVHLYLRQVSPFMARRAGRYDFFYDSFRRAAIDLYAAAPDDPRPDRPTPAQWHQMLAHYFQGQPLDLPAESGRRPNLRKLDELPWQQTRAALWPEVAGTLTDLPFLEAKAAAGLVFELANDFRYAAGRMPADRPERSLLRLLEEAIRTDAHFIGRRPAALFQCLWNRCWWYDAPEAAHHYDARDGRWPRGEAPWERPGPKLFELLQRWRAAKESAEPAFRWLRSLRPPEVMLGGGQLASLRGHEGAVGDVAYSRDGQWIVSASPDRTARVWDADDGRELTRFGGHEGPVTAVAVAPDGRWVATGSADKTVRLWDPHGDRELATFRGHDDTVNRVAVSPDGRLVASASEDKTVRVWDVQTGAERARLDHQMAVRGVAFSADGKAVFCAQTLKVWVWDVETGSYLFRHRGHRGKVIDVACSADGRFAVSGGQDMTVRVWDAKNGREQAIGHGHEEGVTCVAVFPDGRRAASGSADKTVRVWDTQTGEQLACLRGPAPVSAVAVSPDGSRLAAGCGDGAIRVWAVGTGAEAARLCNHEEKLTDLAVSPDGHWVATASFDTTARLWGAADGRQRSCLIGHLMYVTGVAFSADSRRLASVSFEGAVRVWDVETGAALANFQGKGRQVAFSVDGGHIFLDADEQGVLTLDAYTGAPAGADVPLRQAQPAATLPYRGQVVGQETVVEEAASAAAVAWFPAPLKHLAGGPGRRLWAGWVSNHLYLLALEGVAAEPAAAPPAAASQHGYSPEVIRAAQLGTGDVPSLIRQFDHPDPRVHRPAAKVLCTKRLSADEVEQLRPAFSRLMLQEDHHFFFTGTLIHRLGPPAVPLLVPFLAHADPLVRLRCALMLNGFGPRAKAALPALIRGLSDGSLDRQQANVAIANIGLDHNVPLPELVQALRDGDRDVRTEAAESIGDLGPEGRAAVPALVEALADEELGVRQAAEAALGRVAPQARAAAIDLMDKGAALGRAGRYEEALKLFEDGLAADPSYFVALACKGEALRAMGRPAEAVACLDGALRFNPNSGGLWSLKGEALAALDRPAEAVACYDRAIDLDPASARAWCAKGRVCSHSLGKLEDARACFERALQLDPGAADVWVDQAAVLGDLGRQQEALACLEEAKRLGYPKIDELIDIFRRQGATSGGTDALQEGGSLLAARKWGDAMARFEEVLRRDSSSAVAWLGKGIALKELEREDEAVNCFGQVLRLAPDNVQAMTEMGHTLFLQEKDKDALDWLEEARRTDPRYAPAWLCTGGMLMFSGRFQEAIAYLEEAARLGLAEAADMIAQCRKELRGERTHD